MGTAGGSQDELTRALRCGPFELAMKLAIRDSNLSLDRLAHRLAQQGMQISTSTLSNWQTGRSRPERRDSLRALRFLERSLELPRDSLLRLLGPRRARGRWVGHIPGSVGYDALFADHTKLAAILAEVNDADEQRYRAISMYDRVKIDRQRRFRAIRVQQLVTAIADGVDSCVVFFHAEDGPLPTFAAPDGPRIGRVRTDTVAGITVAELLLDCRLNRGDVFQLEYEFRFLPSTPAPTDYYYRAFRNPCRQYLLRVHFDPAAQPVRCAGFRTSKLGSPDAESTPLPSQKGLPTHFYTADAQPGIYGIRWEWN